MHLPYRYLLVVISLLSIFFIVRGSDEHFQFSSQPAILIPGTIQVNLIGFKEDGGEEYGINPIQFQQLLEQTYKLIKPDLSHDAKDSFIHFFIRYIVNNQVKKNPLTQLEDLIASEIVSQLKTNSAAINNILSIPVSTKLEKLLNEVYEDTTPNRNAPDKYGVTIVNPSFPRIVKQVISELPSISPHLIVGYNWNFNGIPTNAFLASKPYAFIDVTALAVYVGPSSSTHGVRNPLSIPNLVEFGEYTVDKKNVIFEAALGSAIHSLSTHVFFPDISFAPYISTWNQIFVPVMVFKNHGTHVELQEQRIHQELRKIFHNTIKLDVKFGTHSLHDHKHVSMAVSKSLRTHLVNELDENGHYITKGRQYLDSKTLAVELRRSADALASLLLDNAVPGVSNKITLPVYIFSLHGLNPELLLDNDELVSVEHDAVIILSTDQEKVPLPLIADMNTVYINATDPNRHIIAGVAMSQGLVPPYKVLSNLDSESEYDYTWAFGNHPFGPFSNSMTLPDIFAGNIRRNAVLSRIHKGVSIITETIAGIDNFAEKYLHGVLESTDDISTWIESAYHGTNPETNPLLYTGTVDRLHAEIMDLSTQLDGIHHKLRQQNYEEAFALSQSFIFSSKIVKEYSKQELEAAEIRLQCCRIHHSPPSNIIYYAVIATALSIVAICAPLFVVFGYMIYKKFDNMKKNPPSQKRSSRKSVLLS